MLICAFDTETDGLRAPIHIVQIAAVLVDTDDARELAHFSLVVRPDGYEVPAEAAAIHGITTETALRVGVPLVVALAALTQLWSIADRRVAHNAEYDERVVRGEMERLGRASAVRTPPLICTKVLAEPVLRLPPTERMIAAGYGDRFKAPSLAECVRALFGEEMLGAHGALADTRYCARVYLELMRRGHA